MGDTGRADRLAAELNSTRRRLESALGAARMAYWDWDAQSDRMVAAKSMADVYGLAEGESIRSSEQVLELVHPQDRVRHRDTLLHAAERGVGWHTEFRIIRPHDGALAWLEERATVTTDHASGRRYTTGLVWDISSRKRAEEALERTRREAQGQREAQLDRERRGREAAEGLMAVMSHELRTPITSVRGTAALLARNPARPDAPDLVSDIQEEADRLIRIIDDLMVLSGVDRGLIQLAPEPVLLQHLLPAVVSDVARRHEGADIRLELPEHVSAVSADATALRQIVYNLVANAARYAGQAGPVIVRASDVTGGVEVAVLDRGPGLGEDPDSLFELFQRGPRVATLGPGSGIGLYVVRELIRAMGTSISARTRDEGGAAFSFQLPAVTDMEA
jgi:PAS domain S-box-containing protein